MTDFHFDYYTPKSGDERNWNIKEMVKLFIFRLKMPRACGVN